MKSLLIINSSARVTRSITRRLSDRFAQGWRARYPDARILTRDVGLQPTPTIDEGWIAAAFAAPGAETAAMKTTLALSDTLVDEIIQADAIVIGVPMYNFGMPGHLKVYMDQIVRVGRTFAFDASASEPYQPLLESKPVVVLTSAGDGAILPGGPLAHLNFLEGHLETILGFIGLTDVRFVRVGFDEYGDSRVKRSIAVAETEVDKILDQLATVRSATQRSSLSPLLAATVQN